MSDAASRGRPLRLAYVSASLDLGGSERQMVNLATRLPKDRFAVEFVLLVDAGPLAAVAEAAGIPVHVLRWHRGQVPLGRLRRLGDVARYIRLGRHRRYDIIDAWLFHAYALAAVSRDLTGTPVLVAGRRSLSDFKEGAGWFNRTADWIATRRVDAIVANSCAVRDDVARREQIDPARIHVIHNGIPRADPMPDEERARLREAWGAGPGDVVIGCVANYKNGKGLETLIGLTDRLRSVEPRVVTVLVGEGPRRTDLEAEIVRRDLTGRVVLHGHAVDARRLYGAFDVGLQASASEGLPNAVLEASNAGLPVVASDVGGTREIVVDGETGFLFPLGGDEAALAALLRLIADPALRRTMGVAGQTRIDRVFGVDRLVAETAALYERLATGRVRGS